MKPTKIGDLNLSHYKTEILATPEVKAKLKSEKIPTSFLIPNAYIWYDSELLEITDHNDDGKIDEQFGKEFKIIYFLPEQSLREFEQKTLQTTKTQIKNISLKYIILKG